MLSFLLFGGGPFDFLWRYFVLRDCLVGDEAADHRALLFGHLKQSRQFGSGTQSDLVVGEEVLKGSLALEAQLANH